MYQHSLWRSSHPCKWRCQDSYCGCYNWCKEHCKQDPSFGHPEKFCENVSKTRWESATITTSHTKIIDAIKRICKRDPLSGKVVTGGIISCEDSNWLLSWTINRQGQFREQKEGEICIWVYSLFVIPQVYS
ncbi:MAG: oleate hydratase [Anaerostipes hadrus]